MTNPAGPREGWRAAKINQDLASAHRLIMEAGVGPSEALLKGKASRGKLASSTVKLRHAIQLIEGVLNA